MVLLTLHMELKNVMHVLVCKSIVIYGTYFISLLLVLVNCSNMQFLAGSKTHLQELNKRIVTLLWLVTKKVLKVLDIILHLPSAKEQVNTHFLVNTA